MVTHLKGLISLQSCDSRIQGIRKKMEQGPTAIRQLEEDLNRVEKGLMEDVEQLEQIKRQRREVEREIDAMETRIAKSNVKLSNIRSNKEYTAALKEIDELGREKSLLEDRALGIMEQAEERESALAGRRIEVEETKQRVARDREKIQLQLKELQEELDQLESERRGLCGSIDEALLRRYDFIRSHRGGLAVSPVVKGVCLTCHIGIPPQKFNELIRGDEIMDCPNCQRIIYWGEDERLQEGPEKNKAGMLEQNE